MGKLPNIDDIDAATALQISRKHESKMNLLRGRSDAKHLKAGDAEFKAFRKAAEAKFGTLDQLSDPEPDLEGTQNELSDREGNFADDAEQARSGGIGIHDSNSVDPDEVEETQEEMAEEGVADSDELESTSGSRRNKRRGR